MHIFYIIDNKIYNNLLDYSIYNLVSTYKFDKIQIITLHLKKKINKKYNRRMIEQFKLNKTTILNFR